MFGLDARIALAIFGALSVISGAALYSAIQQSKVVALITEINEVGKAYDAYYLDTGVELTFNSSPVYLEIHNLVTSTVPNWNGPYLSYETNAELYSLSHKTYDRIRISEMLDGNWISNGSSSLWEDSTKCTGGTVGGTCSIWIVFRDMPLDTYNALDEMVDGSVDSQSGNVRYVSWSGIPYVTFVKYRPKQN